MKKILKIIIVILSIIGFSSCNYGCRKAKIINIKLTEEHYAYVVKKGNSTLVNDFNLFLDEIKINGSFEEILAKYFEGIGEKVGVNYTTSDVVNTDKKFVVATNCPFSPFEYIDIDGLIYGIDIEIARLYALKNNLELVVRNIDFNAIFTSVDAGYCDMGMAGITITSDREALYDFTSTYYEASQVLVVLEDNEDFNNCKTVNDVEDVLKTLTKKKIGYQIGTTANWYVCGDEDWGYEGFSNLENKGYNTSQLAIQDMINGQIYGVIVDEAPGKIMVEAINYVN